MFTLFVLQKPQWRLLLLTLICNRVHHGLLFSGKNTMFKLNQYIAEAFDVGCGGQFQDPGGGKIGQGTCFVVHRPLEPGKCDGALVCGRRGLVEGCPYIAHKEVKVGVLFQGTNDGIRLIQEEHSKAMKVTYISPQLQHPVSVKVEGIMPNSAKPPRHANKEPLPRVSHSFPPPVSPALPPRASPSLLSLAITPFSPPRLQVLLPPPCLPPFASPSPGPPRGPPSRSSSAAYFPSSLIATPFSLSS